MSDTDVNTHVGTFGIGYSSWDDDAYNYMWTRWDAMKVKSRQWEEEWCDEGRILALLILAGCTLKSTDPELGICISVTHPHGPSGFIEDVESILDPGMPVEDGE